MASNKDTRTISVSELKSVLLAVIRSVEQGQRFEVTKGKQKVAMLVPWSEMQLPVVGFARGAVVGGDLDVGEEGWTFDVKNLTAK